MHVSPRLAIGQAKWPVSDAVTCVVVTSFGGQLNGKKTMSFMEAEDSAEGLVKVATHEKVYKCLAVCQASWKGKNTQLNRMCIFLTKGLLTFRGTLQVAALSRPSVEPSVFVKAFIFVENCSFYLDCPPNSARDSFRNGPLKYQPLYLFWSSGRFLKAGKF